MVREEMVEAALNHFDQVQKIMVRMCWRVLRHYDGSEEGPSLDDLHVLKEALVVVKTNYLHLLMDRDHLLALDEIYFDVLRQKDNDMGKIGEDDSMTQGYDCNVPFFHFSLFWGLLANSETHWSVRGRIRVSYFLGGCFSIFDGLHVGVCQLWFWIPSGFSESFAIMVHA